MATLKLRQTWVNLMSTGEGLSAYTGGGRTWSDSQDGEVRRYAGGRFRSIVTEGTRRLQNVVLKDMTQTQVSTLEGWLGETVCVRDTRGRKMFGVFFDITIADKKHKGYYDVSIQIEEVSFVEGG